MKLRIALSAVALSACLAKSKPVIMPNGQHAVRIECHYNFANCERQARKECNGDYERVGNGDMSCKDCGMEWNNDAMASPPEGNNVYKGVLYVRCK